MTEALQKFLEDKLRTLERKRKGFYAWYMLYKFTIFPLFYTARAVSAVFLVITLIFPPFLIYLAISGGVYILTATLNHPNRVFKYRVKEKILESFFTRLNPSFTYQLGGYNDYNLRDSKIFDKYLSQQKVSIDGDDYVKGEINKTPVDLVQIQFYKSVINYGKTIGGCLLSILLFPVFLVRGLTNEANEDDFLPIFGVARNKILQYKGLFIAVDLKNNSKEELRIIPKTQSTKTTTLINQKRSTPLKEIKTESNVLTTNYNIYCTDTTKVNTLLSNEFITFLETKLAASNYKHRPELTFTNGKMYVAIPQKQSYFELNVTKKVKELEWFNSYIKQLEWIEDLIKLAKKDTQENG